MLGKVPLGSLLLKHGSAMSEVWLSTINSHHPMWSGVEPYYRRKDERQTWSIPKMLPSILASYQFWWVWSTDGTIQALSEAWPTFTTWTRFVCLTHESHCTIVDYRSATQSRIIRICKIFRPYVHLVILSFSHTSFTGLFFDHGAIGADHSLQVFLLWRRTMASIALPRQWACQIYFVVQISQG